MTRLTTPRNALEPPKAPAGFTPVVATDLDRTFTQANLKLSPEALRKAKQLRTQGIRMVLVTGRRAADMPLATLRDAFDAMVLEGGAVWGRPGQWTIHPTPTTFWDVADELESRGHDVQTGWGSFSAPIAAIEDLDAHAAILTQGINVDRIDVTPRGIDKATGFTNALAALRVAQPWVLAIGDGRNDIPLAKLAHSCVAVANAEAELMEAASVQSPYAAHRGFLWAVQGLAKWNPAVMA